jgi:hypothetical protein
LTIGRFMVEPPSARERLPESDKGILDLGQPLRTHDAADYPGAEHDPLAYPGRRPPWSYVYADREIARLRPRGEELRLDDGTALEEFLRERGAAPLAERTPVLAVGSNGCPGRLAEKFGDGHVIPVLVGTVVGTAVVYGRRFAKYGALAATWHPTPCSWATVSLNWLDPVQVELMDASELLGEVYERRPVPAPFRVDGGPSIGGVTAYEDPRVLYLDGEPVRLAEFPQGGTEWPILDEREVLAEVLDRVGVLPDEPIEIRHRALVAEPELRAEVEAFLEGLVPPGS